MKCVRINGIRERTEVLNLESSKKRKVQKKLFSVIYGRTAVILLLILLQILVMVFGIYS